MKYNSNMKNFKPVVLKNLFAMCGRDEKIPELAKDGSPAPLREHLKEYGKTLKMDNGNDIMYDFLPSRGIKIQLDHQINVDGDSRLELSVSQMATFIRGCVQDGSWLEPLPTEESEQQHITFLDVLRENYPELEGIPDEEIITELCPLENGFTESVKLDQECNYNECDNCWYKVYDSKFRADEDTQKAINVIVEKHNSNADGKAVPAERDTQNSGMSGQAPSAEIIPIEIAKIKPHPNNPRADVGDISELAESIRAKGIMQNLTVVPDDEPGFYRCLIGHRRLAAAKSAGLENVPCAIARDMTLADQVAVMLAENMQRQDLTPLEQADGIQMMFDLGDTLEKVVEKTGISESTVRKRVKLAKFENKDEVKKSFERGATLADFDKLEKVKDPQTREKLVKSMGTNNFSWELENAVKDEIITGFLGAFAEKINKPDYEKMKIVRSYAATENLRKPESYDPNKKYFYVFSHGYGQLYVEKSEEETEKKPKTSDAEYERKKAEAERKVRLEKLTEIKKRMEKRRLNFVRNFSYTGKKSAELDFVRGLELVLMENFSAGNDHTEASTNLDKLLGKRGENYDRMNALIAENITGTRLSVWLGYACLNVTAEPWIYNLSYGSYICERLKILYRFLEACGYEISDEERAFIDGTHELYTKEG